MSIVDSLTARLDERLQLGRFRSRKVVEGAQASELKVDGKSYLSFCSNDYLGLANHPKVKASFAHAVSQYGVGSGASHLVCGHSVEHHALEEELAEFTGRERVLLFSTGYMANIGVINALTSRGDLVLQDKLNHASLIDGGLLTAAEFVRYRHNDIEHLASRLERISANKKLIVTDGVFSMDGDIAPLPAIASLATQHNSWLMVDDAHGFGCLGAQGGGCAQYFGLDQQSLPILVGTLGKAFGTFGAFVAGCEPLIETLIQFARSYVYTTAIPPAVAAATRTSLKLLQEENWRREQLQTLIQQFKRGCQALGLSLLPSDSPIQPLLIGEESMALKASEILEKAGIWVTPIRPPTVPEGTSRLRITLSAEHSKAQVETLLETLQKVSEFIERERQS